jgi:RNA polymerase sigma-70 factor (ECF subfamily)
MESLDEPDEDGQTSPALLRDWKEIPSEALERKEVRSLLHKAISALPVIYREVFQLRDIEQLSVSEAAEVLGITAGSVKVRLHRARMMLQRNLAPQLKEMAPKRRWWAWS